MSDPVGDQDRRERGDAGDQDSNTAKDQTLPPPGAPVGDPPTRDPAHSHGNTNTHSQKSTFDIVTRIVELVVAAIVGLALVSIGFLQYTVYTRQADIMQIQTQLIDANQRPFVSIKEIRHFPIDPDFEAHSQGDDTFASWIFEPVWRNDGNTATHNLRLFLDKAILAERRPFEEEPALRRTPQDSEWRDALIPAKGEMAAQDYYATLAQLLASQRGAGEFYLGIIPLTQVDAIFSVSAA